MLSILIFRLAALKFADPYIVICKAWNFLEIFILINQ
jgi:hypothetical protein